MYICIEKSHLKSMAKKNLILEVALWTSTKSAIDYYCTSNNIYASYVDEDLFVKGYSTPVRVFLVNDLEIISVQEKKKGFFLGKCITLMP